MMENEEYGIRSHANALWQLLKLKDNLTVIPIHVLAPVVS